MSRRDVPRAAHKLIDRLESRILFSTLPPVGAPSDLAVTAISSTAVQLTWTDNSANEVSFFIYRSFDQTNWVRVAAVPRNSTRWTNTDLLPGTTYFYEMKAHAKSQLPEIPLNSAVSEPVTVTTLTSVEDSFAQLDPVTGVLTVRGTNLDDIIAINASGTAISANLNGHVLNFAQSQVTRISIYGLDGHDRILIGANVGATNISGGNGNDTIVANDGDDRIDGGAGDDMIRGGDGNDVLAGGTGRDTIYGEGGSDTIDGGAGNDKLLGGDGDDSMIGAAGSDRIFGQVGNDTLISGGGHDTLVAD